MEKLFYQSSLPRAGSTLLQNILAQNPDIYATPTSGVLELVFAARGNYTNSAEFQAQDSEQMKKGFLNFCQKGMIGFYEAITDKKYVVDKSRGWGIHYSFLDSVFPNPNTIPKRIDIWANGVPVGMALERLSEIHRLGYDKHILFVKFEDLCLYPETEMHRIYNYFEIPYFQHDFDNIEQVTKEDDEVYGVFGDHTIRTKLEPVQSQAKKILGADVCNWIFDNYKWFYDRFNYKK
jgi:sulfotransferase